MGTVLPKFTVEKVEKLPVQSKYGIYHRAVAALKDGEAVVIKELDQKDCWKIQANMKNDLVVIATRSIKEADGTYTLYLFKTDLERINKKEDK